MKPRGTKVVHVLGGSTSKIYIYIYINIRTSNCDGKQFWLLLNFM